MNILFLTPQLPYPPRQGASMRNYFVLKGVAAEHTVSLLSYREPHQPQDEATLAPLLALVKQLVVVEIDPRPWARRLAQFAGSLRPDLSFRLASAQFDQQLRHLLQQNQFDIVQIEGLELARTIEIVRQVSPHSRIVFDNHNVETALQERTMRTDWQHPRRWLAALYSTVQVWKLRRYEIWASTEADAVTVVSETDRELLQVMAPAVAAKIEAIPNCIDVAPYLSLAEQADTAVVYDLVFVGKMDYRPNVDGVLWFASEIWPLIRAAR
ncbi:MAG: glycosyltransferase, partial [Anaerolineales bacterium]|nr:glycosyltransferase [Anaerolineales bacterium]